MKEMSANYPFKAWAASIVLGSLFLSILLYVTDTGFTVFALVSIFFYSAFFGFVVSLPTLFIFYLACKDFVRYSLKEALKKALLALVGITCMLISFYFLAEDIFYTQLAIPLAYAFAIIISCFLFRLQKDEEETGTE